MTKSELQQNAVLISRDNPNLILQWATGCGKSKAAIDIQNDFKPNKTLILIAEIAHENNWREEYIKLGKEELLDNTEIVCYASLKNYRDVEVELLILDEGHHANSELRLDILSSIKAKRVLVLTATLSYDKKIALEQVFGKFCISVVTLDSAIREGILPKPQIYLIPLQLDNKYFNCIVIEEHGRKDKREIIRCKIDQRWKYIKNKTQYPNITLVMSCTQKEKYEYLCDQSDYWKHRYFVSRQEFMKIKWLQYGSQRKRFLGECKIEDVKLLLSLINRSRPKKRFICFCASIDQAEQLGKNTIHSKKRGSLKIINQFNNKEIDNIFAVNMLQEGQNLTALDIGIIVQLDGEERSFIQRFGRTLRSDNPIQFIFYYPNTRDEDYLINALEGINIEYVQHVDDISTLKI